MKKQIIIPVVILLSLITATALVVLYGKGYRISFAQDTPKIDKTGLLVVNSTPNGAQVLIENHLTTATNNTINLSPGIYNIKIQKEGYFPWQKKLKIEKEVVTKVEATLYPVAPKLESIATTAVLNPLIDPSGTKIAFQIASESSARKNGIYILNMNTNIPIPILTLQSSSAQIADDTTSPFSKAKLKWSPDGTQILAQLSDPNQTTTTTYLLKTDQLNEPKDITAILPTIEDSWSLQKQQKDKSLHAGIKENVRSLISNNFSILAWSPDESKILYEASISAQLPLIIKPRRLGIDTLMEKRQITQGEIYVYDIKEDTNMKIPVVLPDSCQHRSDQNQESLTEECNLPIAWSPNSNHLLYINNKKIIVMDSDGSNWITIYAGPFIGSFAAFWPDNSRIVILTNLGNPDASPTLYTIGLK